MAWVEKRILSDGTPSYKVGWRDPTKRVRSKTFRRSVDARAFAREIERSKDVGMYRDPNLGKVPLGEFFQHHMATSPHLAVRTRGLYETLWRIHIGPRLGHVRLNSISKVDVKSFLAELREAGVGEPTVSGVHRLLRAVLSAAVDEDRIPANPASNLRIPGPPKPDMLFLDASEVSALADAVEDRFIALVYLLGYCGPRIGEAAALRVKHIHLMNRRVLVEEAVKEVPSGLVTGPTKSKQKRSVPLPPFLVDMLARHIALYSDPNDPEALVFTSSLGLPLRPSGFRKHVLKPALAGAGLSPKIRTHDLRHTAAAISIAAGIHAKAVQEMLGHSSIRTTLDIYSHIMESVHQETANVLDAVYRKAEAEGSTRADVVGFPSDEGGEAA